MNTILDVELLKPLAGVFPALPDALSWRREQQKPPTCFTDSPPKYDTILL